MKKTKFRYQADDYDPGKLAEKPGRSAQRRAQAVEAEYAVLAVYARRLHRAAGVLGATIDEEESDYPDSVPAWILEDLRRLRDVLQDAPESLARAGEESCRLTD